MGTIGVIVIVLCSPESCSQVHCVVLSSPVLRSMELAQLTSNTINFGWVSYLSSFACTFNKIV